MHPDFFEMARLARERGIRLSTITNGSLFSAERIDRILESGIATLFVSIESPREDEFRDIRGGVLSKVIDGIRALLAARRARQLVHPTVGFSVTVLKRTQSLMPEIAALYAELGMDGGISAHMLNTMPSYTGFYNRAMEGQVLSPMEQALAWTRYARIIQEPAYQASTAAVHFSDEVFGQNDPARQSTAVRHKLAKEYRSCPWLDEGMYVNRHGHASGCARIKDTAAFGLGDDFAPGRGPGSIRQRSATASPVRVSCCATSYATRLPAHRPAMTYGPRGCTATISRRYAAAMSSMRVKAAVLPSRPGARRPYTGWSAPSSGASLW